jgi:hypothetical protein
MRTIPPIDVEDPLHSAYEALNRFHESYQKSKSSVSEKTLSALQKKIEAAKNQLEQFNAQVPQESQKLRKQVLDSVERVEKETLVLMSGMQAQANIVIGALKDLKRLLRKGERVEDTGKPEQQGH